MKNDPKEVQRILEEHKYEDWWCGYYLPDGWVDLVYDLHNDLLESDPEYQLVQVKEKFGGLRFYIQFPISDRGQLLIRLAEDKSLEICQECGAPGSLRKRGWWATLCDEHDTDEAGRGYPEW